MDNSIFGELKVYLQVIRIPLHASQVHRQYVKRVLLQSIECYYVDRHKTYERFKQANPNLKHHELWAEFKYQEPLCD